MTNALRVPISQQRSQDRVDDIKAAARAHYEAVGRDRFNTGDVAREAGCAVGTVYRYFTDRVALMDAIAPHRDDAQILLDSIKNVKTMFIPDDQKWATVLTILDS